MTSLTHKAVEVFAHDLYATRATGVTIEAVEQDFARCQVELQELHRNAMGGVMGGVMDRTEPVFLSHRLCRSRKQPMS